MPAAGSRAPQAAPCNEARPFPKDRPGPLTRTDNPGRLAGLTGSQPQERSAPTDNHPTKVGRCFAHRTDSRPGIAIPE